MENSSSDWPNFLGARQGLKRYPITATAKEIVALKADVSNDIAGRRVVAEARTDIAQMKATLAEFRERIDRLESNEDGRKHA